MGSPIAAGSVIVAKSSLASFELAKRRPLLGVCESATAPVNPGDPPTNVAVAWEDGTRFLYLVAIGLVSSVAPSAASLLGTVMQFGGPGTILPFPLLEAGTRLRGPVVMHAEYFEANGDELVGPGEQNQVLTIKTKFGFANFPRTGLSVVPNL